MVNEASPVQSQLLDALESAAEFLATEAETTKVFNDAQEIPHVVDVDCSVNRIEENLGSVGSWKDALGHSYELMSGDSASRKERVRGRGSSESDDRKGGIFAMLFLTIVGTVGFKAIVALGNVDLDLEVFGNRRS